MTTTRSKSADIKRLDSAAWIEAALTAMAESGIDGVRVDVLAKRLNVTKGSFYWHFKDRAELLESLLEAWRRQATLELIQRLDRGELTAEARLRRLLRIPFTGRRSPWAAEVELAIRLWGRQDRRARAALVEVDQLRLRYIAGLIEACGAPSDEAQARAVLAYSYMRVSATLIGVEANDLMEQCERLLVGIQPATVAPRRSRVVKEG